MKKVYLVNETFDEFLEKVELISEDEDAEIQDTWYDSDNEDEAEEKELAKEPTAAEMRREAKRIAKDDSTYSPVNRIKALIQPELDQSIQNLKRSVSFLVDGRPESGIPLRYMGGDTAVLMDTPGGLKKFKLEDMQLKESATKKYVSESFKDYE